MSVFFDEQKLSIAKIIYEFVINQFVLYLSFNICGRHFCPFIVNVITVHSKSSN